jgi:hypothetical protein
LPFDCLSNILKFFCIHLCRILKLPACISSSIHFF